MARKILLADDSVTAQNMGRKILADAGYEVITVNNGSAALKKISEIKPDLIVLDVYMPGYSGLEVCQRLKETSETARIPILLTVGKLEPFKPEEAKRVRAEGFIVKPFEASELLAALTRLEDKMVPRAESSKPGRFARANAALDDGRYDKTVAVEEDTGWKNRISFPSKKKKAAEEEEINVAANHQPANKDSRTVEHKPTDPAPEAAKHQTLPESREGDRQSGGRRIDLGALVPEGLPKDVTAEEIAALAAAAAQMKGKSAPEVPAAQTPVAETSSAPAPAAEIPIAKAEAEERLEAQSIVPPEARKESKAETIATFAVQKPHEPVEVPAETPVVAVNETPSISTPSPADIVSTTRASEPEATRAEGAVGKQPATMAAAAGAAHLAAPSRWTAVAVAIAADEASISLEQEMQQAQAAADIAQASPAGIAPEISPIPESPVAVQSSSAIEPIAPELVAPGTASFVPEVAQAGADFPAPSTVAAEVIPSTVKEFDRVATHIPSQPPAPQESEPTPVRVSEPFSGSVPEIEKADARPALEEKVAEPELTSPEALAVETPQEEASAPVALTPDQKPDQNEAQKEDQKEDQNEEPNEVSATEETSALSSPQSEAAAQASADVVAQNHAAEEIVSHKSDSAAQPGPGTASLAGTAHGESEIAQTTAAAWATWRRIRESGESPATHSSSPNNEFEPTAPVPHDAAAALAVAAGAEKAPEDSIPEDSGDIANIVDSVLADLRPKIVEEISRKLGKKK